MTEDIFLRNQREHCKKTKSPFFMPLNGVCWSCGRNILPILIERGKDGKTLITGCPICHKSYCA